MRGCEGEIETARFAVAQRELTTRAQSCGVLTACPDAHLKQAVSARKRQCRVVVELDCPRHCAEIPPKSGKTQGTIAVTEFKAGQPCGRFCEANIDQNGSKIVETPKSPNQRRRAVAADNKRHGVGFVILDAAAAVRAFDKQTVGLKKVLGATTEIVDIADGVGRTSLSETQKGEKIKRSRQKQLLGTFEVDMKHRTEFVLITFLMTLMRQSYVNYIRKKALCGLNYPAFS